MASDYYKLVSTTNRHTDWTTEVILEKDENGEPTKVARAGEPVQLTADDRKKLEGLGYTVEQSSKSEADEVSEARSTGVGGDVTGSAPVFGDSEAPNQAVSTDQPAASKDAGKSK